MNDDTPEGVGEELQDEYNISDTDRDLVTAVIEESLSGAGGCAASSAWWNGVSAGAEHWQTLQCWLEPSIAFHVYVLGTLAAGSAASCQCMPGDAVLLLCMPRFWQLMAAT